MKGANEGLNEEVRGMCTGIRETRSGFEALTSSSEDIAAIIGNNIVIEKATLEDIMVYMVKGV